MTSWVPLQLGVSQAGRFIVFPLFYDSSTSLDFNPRAFDFSPPRVVRTVDGVVTLQSKQPVFGPYVIFLGLLVRVSHRPVLPKPPPARVVSSSSVTTSNTTLVSDVIIICATRSPFDIV